MLWVPVWGNQGPGVVIQTEKSLPPTTSFPSYLGRPHVGPKFQTGTVSPRHTGIRSEGERFTNTPNLSDYPCTFRGPARTNRV